MSYDPSPIPSYTPLVLCIYHFSGLRLQSAAIVFKKIHSFHFFPCKSLCFQNWPCRKIGQGHPRVNICANYDGLESPILHTKFRGNRPAGSGDFWVVFTIYGRGGHLGHVIKIPRTNFRSPYPWMLHIKFQFNWPSGFREEELWTTDD